MSQPAPLIQKIERLQARKNVLPDFRAGDTVRVQVKIREGEKERLQAFEGVVTARAKPASGSRASFTVRKVSYGVGVERIFPEGSPNVSSVEILSRGKVRQARLYYLRELSGKAARIKERAYDPKRAEEAAMRAAEAAADAAHAAAAAEGGEVAEGEAAPARAPRAPIVRRTKTAAKREKKEKKAEGKAARATSKPAAKDKDKKKKKPAAAKK
jgi:large subunit ribosomal protein L19